MDARKVVVVLSLIVLSWVLVIGAFYVLFKYGAAWVGGLALAKK
jgi:hypothetical protein